MDHHDLVTRLFDKNSEFEKIIVGLGEVCQVPEETRVDGYGTTDGKIGRHRCQIGGTRALVPCGGR